MVLNNGGKKKRLACYNFVMKIVATLVCSAGARNTLGPKFLYFENNYQFLSGIQPSSGQQVPEGQEEVGPAH